MGKSVLVVLLGFIGIFNIIANNINKTSTEAEVALYDSYGRVMAQDIAESGVNAVLSILAYNAYWRDKKSGTIFNGGTFTAGALADTTLGPYGVKVSSYSNFNGIQDSVFAYLTFWSTAPIGVRAGVTANTDIEINGQITIDGRDHDEDGNVISSSGTLGISTSTTFTQTAGQVGGTVDSVDFEPKKKQQVEPTTIEEEANWGDYGFPDTPDKVMGGEDAGYPEGTLKRIAQSGFQGSQYVTHWNDLTQGVPLSGVTYVELDPCEIWQGIDLNGSGILVVHNSTTNSVMKLIASGSLFKGLIIADNIDKIHGDVLGAVVILTTSEPAGNVIGNSHGSIKYCSSLVGRATTGMPGVKCFIEIVGWVY